MNIVIRVFVQFFALLVLAGCTFLENYFPDKERDYQYTSEIPMMNWPSELRRNKPTEAANEEGVAANLTDPAAGSNNNEGSTNPVSGTSSTADTGTEQPPSQVQVATTDSATESSTESSQASSTQIVPADEGDGKDSVSSVEVVKYDDGESRLRLGAGFGKAWRVVNKALTRNLIEITKRKHDTGEIIVQYDPDEKRNKDDSFMDEISFIFNGIGMNDQEYILKLEEHNDKTDVIVLNDEHVPLLNDESAISLLRRMADTIKADLAKKAKSEDKAE